MLALVPTRYPPQLEINDKVIGLSGTRKPMNSEPQVIIFKESFVIGITMVNEPGQNFSASFKEIGSKETIFRADLIESHSNGKGLFSRIFSSNIFFTEL